MFNNLSEENQPLLAEKIARLEKELILETRADECLRLEHKINELKGKSSSFNSLKTNKNQHVITVIFALFVIILAMWVSSPIPTPVEQSKQIFIVVSVFQTISFYLTILGGFIFLFIVTTFLLTFIEKQRNKKIYAQNKIYSKEFVDDLQKKLVEKDIKIKLLDEQIKALEEMICHIFDALINLSSTAVSKKEIGEAFNKIKNNDIKMAKKIFEKLRKLSKENKNPFDEAKYLRYLSVINIIERNQKLAELFYEESKKIAPNDPEAKKLDVIFSNEKALFPDNNIIYNPKIIYPIQEDGEVDLRRIKELVEQLYQECRTYQIENNNIELYIKFGLKGGLGRREPKENESLRTRYEVIDKNNNLIIKHAERVAERKSKAYSLEEFKRFLDTKAVE